MKKLITDYMQIMAKNIVEAQDLGEESPNEIFNQVRPLLVKMGLSNMSDRAKTSLVPGMVQGENSLYQITLRRNAMLTADTIDRIKRNEINFYQLTWDTKAILVRVWWPYKAPDQATPQNHLTPQVYPNPKIPAV